MTGKEREGRQAQQVDPSFVRLRRDKERGLLGAVGEGGMTTGGTHKLGETSATVVTHQKTPLVKQPTFSAS